MSKLTLIHPTAPRPSPAEGRDIAARNHTTPEQPKHLELRLLSVSDGCATVGVPMREEAVKPIDVDVLDAIHAALTRDAWAKVWKFARGHCEALAGAGIHVDDDVVDDMVADAIHDTAFGTVTWDPSLCMLTTHLCNVIKRRVWLRVARERQFPHERMTAGDVRAEAVTREASLTAPPADTEEELGRREVAAQLREALWSAACEAGDETLQLLLTAYDDEVYARKDVVEYLGLTVDAYRAAVKRLRRMLDQLPEELRLAARHAMRGAA